MFRKNYSKSSSSSTTSSSSKKCINSVFEQWIQEWRDDAIAKDLQSKHTYTKCLNSLRKYPLPLNSGKECIILEGFGDKICKAIDDKMKKFLDNGGVLHEVISVSSGSDDENVIIETSSKSSYHSNNRNRIASIDKEDERENDLDLISAEKDYSSKVLTERSTNSLIKVGSKSKTSRNSENDESGEAKASKKSRTTGQPGGGKKAYVPEYRSGPYALLVALFNNETEGEEEYMLKKDLIREAQKHCDSSFVSTDPNSHYSAWNSMSSLIKKSLAVKENKLPARYRLTEEGRNLATTILYGAKENTNEETRNQNESLKPTEIYSSKKTNENKDKVIDEEEIDEFYGNEIISEPIKKPLPEPIQSKPTEKSVKKSDDVIELLIDSDDDKTTKKDDDDIITIEEEPKAPLSKMPTNQQPKKKFTKNKNYSDSDSDSDSLPDIGIEARFRYEEKSPVPAARAAPQSSSVKNSVQRFTDRPPSSTGLTQPIETITTSQASSKTSINKFSEQAFLKKTSQMGPLPSVLYSFPAGTFDIMLFVDNCEQSHAKRQDLLIDELKKSKIKYDIGKLNVGDFTWIARRKNGSNNDDIILDFIVERKRMDDFCQSIIDGRYKEQKFRIKKSGITKIVYLIEEFGSMKHMSLPEKSNLLQADVNTQLIDHLIVHHTTDPKDSAHYLIEMTNYITKCFQNSTLNACAKDQLDEFNKTKTSFESVYFMKFDEFNKFSNKNKPLTIKEMFAKCLMKIQGVSQEKCLAIVDLYPTPQALMREYAKCADESKREKLLANIKYGTQQRNIGPAISKLVAQLFYTNGPLN